MAITGCQAKARTTYLGPLLHVADLLCNAGHSLGGAIALLCTLDLLHSLEDESHPSVTCVGFATPAVGNAALAEYVKEKGWQKYITNYLVPGQSLIVVSAVPSTSCTIHYLSITCTCVKKKTAMMHVHEVTSHLEQLF